MSYALSACMCAGHKEFVFRHFIYLLKDSEREQELGKGQRKREKQTPRTGSPTWDPRVSRITPWAKGRRQTAAPPRDP